MRPSKTQISLRIRAVWIESLMDDLWVAKSPTILQAENYGSDQTVLMRSLIRIFDGRSLGGEKSNNSLGGTLWL